MNFEPIRVEVKHSEHNAAWNVVGTQLGQNYKIARVPYHVVDGSDMVTTRNKAEALEHAIFIREAFNADYRNRNAHRQ